MAVLPSNQKGEVTTKSLDANQVPFSKVVYAWNGVRQSLGLLFCELSGLNDKMGQGIWYALKSNQAQHGLLRAALAAASADEGFSSEFPKASKDIEWLLDSIEATVDCDNSAICAEILRLKSHNAEISTLTIYESLNVGNMPDEDIVSKFELYEGYFGAISEFAKIMSIALSCRHHNELGLPRPWPSRPMLPPTRVASIETR